MGNKIEWQNELVRIIDRYWGYEKRDEKKISNIL